MKRGVKLTALAVLVVMVLTGFTSGRGRGGSHKSSGGSGGGCSSSSQNHDSSSSSRYDDDDDDYYGGGSSGSSGSSSGGYTRRPDYGSTPTATSTGGTSRLRDGTATLIRCADAKTPYALVRVSNPNGRTADFRARVAFEDASGIQITSQFGDVEVPARGTATVKVKLGGEGLAAEVAHCELDPEADVLS
ncbi:hypothetical protein [Streptomyces xanthii]|uniref:Uncharacterized protein n=1 Tax=Streptomyces xanthii TaxID=2768069 RepID=A0A7H1BJ35_9ACTN|nr:hypothetical protein [Streptomyces xanthii]QNS08740.1 hypothetical protein IAG42_15165 [Streptomyces xanthii]